MKRFPLVSASLLLSLLCAPQVHAQELPLHESLRTDAWAGGAWAQERAERDRAVDQVVHTTNAAGQRVFSDQFRNYLNVPLGKTGLPLVVFKLAPELRASAPTDNSDAAKQVRQTLDIWAATWKNLGAFGLTPHPSDFDERGFYRGGQDARTLPMGLGFTHKDEAPIFDWNVNLVYVTCGSCHTGRVVRDDGSIMHLFGAPSTEYDQIAFSGAISRTVKAMPTDKKALALLGKVIREALAKKVDREGTDFLYGSSADQARWGDPAPVAWSREKSLWITPWWLSVFRDTTVSVLETVREGLAIRDVIISFLQNGQTGPYDQPGAPLFSAGSPGQLDAFGFGAAIVASLADGAYDPKCVSPKKSEIENRACVPDLRTLYGDSEGWLHPGAAKVDPTSIWRENIEFRVSANWDGSQKFAGARSISTSLAVTANPEAVNVHGAEIMSGFMSDLPPPVYPFAVDEPAAKRGEAVFERHCVRCHAPRNERIYELSEIHTDPNRALQITKPVRDGLLAFFWQTCGDNDFCGTVDGKLASNDEILIPREEENLGYVAAPLDGIWARAPYLHNGSVPNLRALLTGERPATFWRGNIRYDQQNVGFLDADPAKAPYQTMTSNARQYDTSFTGNENGGHLYEVIDGIPILGAEVDGTPIDWSDRAYAGELDDLLEYLKTL